MHTLFPLLAILIVLPSAFSDATPLVIPFNTTHSYGPDGPWPVITVQVGSFSDAAGIQPLSTVDLHPGGIWESIILKDTFCNSNGTVSSDGSSRCLAERAGLYNIAASETVQQNFTDEAGLVWQWSSDAAYHSKGEAANVLDTMKIPMLQGAFAVPNSTISAVSAWQIELPDGTYYSAQVGTLSLGVPATGVQIFSPTVTGQTLPGFEYAHNAIASDSWGLHYGSVSLNQEGSLVLGGYDQSRVLGEVGAFDLTAEAAGHKMIANLLDVQIGVETGSSPFAEGSYTGLLELNASSKVVQPVVINPTVPYLFMSPATCAAITESLPVTYNSQVGLYIWNTTDPQFERIVKSPAFLAFVFQNAGSGNITIKVAFQLLNLTLEPPIVTTTQQYFPCRPFYASDNSGDYFLGKAFLQAAFIGINWQLQKFFLAQAPGPDVGAANINPIGPNDLPISTDPIDEFGGTWAGVWTALSNTDINNTTAVPTGPAGGQQRTSGAGLSREATAGIAVGVIVGALAVAGGVLLSYSYRRRTAVPPKERNMFEMQDSGVSEKYGTAGGHEIGEGLSHEADVGHEFHELEAREEA